MLTRRKFIQQSAIATLTAGIAPSLASTKEENIVMTVNGPIQPTQMKFTLTHEHILADFIGAEQYSKDRYNADEVFNTALPFLLEVKKLGCTTFIDCSPAYLGRDVQLFKRLSKASGLNIITNTGYYGAVNEKFLPKHVYTETSEQIAARWISEWKNGIDGTDIRPGFMKTSVDKAPLTPAQRKIIDAAAITHLATGLTIGVHTGNGDAANEQLEILKARNVAPSARIWIHAQSEPSETYYIETAKKGGWVSFDGVNPGTLQANLKYLQLMKKNNFLDLVLVSQDSGWYHVGEPKGGEYKNYNCIFTEFIPLLKQNGFTQSEIDKIFITNPAKAFEIKIRTL
ncbi:twin-arginine translocation signal domain-containing protein [Danxiaibacter flavus]|uniref:Twin-arginine translocation signal domain-containing protein n=1 Tax=Danxiaibacter flavus TaxID=3049108 RepID=A0ABV3ZF48_9BACT|nr:twin-arginine translocation signal domain-containing protein [Chitinophagaceae bacterium DXS]